MKILPAYLSQQFASLLEWAKPKPLPLSIQACLSTQSVLESQDRRSWLNFWSDLRSASDKPSIQQAYL